MYFSFKLHGGFYNNLGFSLYGGPFLRVSTPFWEFRLVIKEGAQELLWNLSYVILPIQIKLKKKNEMKMERKKSRFFFSLFPLLLLHRVKLQFFHSNQPKCLSSSSPTVEPWHTNEGELLVLSCFPHLPPLDSASLIHGFHCSSI